MDAQDTNKKALLDQMIQQEQITVLFQPVVHLGWQGIMGYEAFVRGPESSPFFTPEALFDAAIEFDQLSELEYVCRDVIIQRFSELNLSGQLFINVNPLSLSVANFVPGRTLQLLKEHHLEASRIIIEISEIHPLQDWKLLQFAVKHYREMGFKISLDEVGGGCSNLKLWAELCPDFVKIERDCIRGVEKSVARRRYVSSILEVAKVIGSQIIIEGVEHTEEYAILRNLGVHLAQGFYFAVPKENPDTAIAPQLFSERTRRQPGTGVLTAVKLVKNLHAVKAMDTLESVGEVFNNDENTHSVAVLTEEGYPLGLVLRSDLLNILASRYGRELFARKPIQDFIKRKTLIVDIDTPLEEVSRTITNAPDHYSDEFIIASNGIAVGRGLLLDLLSSITDLQITRARYANPLTLLPGNVIIQQKLDELLLAKEPFHVAYCDLDNFKPYNDVYGYLRGDELIRLTGRLLSEVCENDLDFIGHIGGDDFIVLFKSKDWEERCHTLLSQIGQIILNYYTEQDKMQGGIVASDRYGEIRAFPFVALSIGALSIERDYDKITTDMIAEIVTAAKKAAKRTSGNSLHIIECNQLNETQAINTIIAS